MTLARLAWIVLATLTAAFGWFVAGEPMLQVTSCEVEFLPGLYPSELCQQPIGDYFGPATVGMLAVPVLLCVFPVVAPFGWVAGAAAGLLLLGSLRGFVTSDYAASVYGFYLPIALVAVVFAFGHEFLSSRRLPRKRVQP
ncbi:hypothetical protein [Prescottella subtropica]|uniref:hypothetical protein n=1 Tax=Prescottella subtropica TaxID=2545757 RepID=UPI0010F4D4FE|nr:hypothetical protein [Prescottella subtropica]